MTGFKQSNLNELNQTLLNVSNAHLGKHIRDKLFTQLYSIIITVIII